MASSRLYLQRLPRSPVTLTSPWMVPKTHLEVPLPPCQLSTGNLENRGRLYGANYRARFVLPRSLVLITFQRLETPCSSEDLPPAASLARARVSQAPRGAAAFPRRPGRAARSADCSRPDSQTHRQVQANASSQNSRKPRCPHRDQPLAESCGVPEARSGIFNSWPRLEFVLLNSN